MGVRLRQKPKGSSVWYVFINHQGKRKSKKIGKDEKLAREVAEKISAKLILGELKVEKINDACPTFKEYAEMWLSLPHDWRESTRYSYTSNLNNHIYPVLGKYRMDAIKRKDLKLFFDQMLSKGLKRLSLNNIRAPISSILAHAEDSEVIEYNPIHGLKLKHKAKHQVDPLTEKEADLLLGEAKNYLDGFYYPALLCALRTGMRIGEIQALKWSDIDFENRQIEVNRSWRKGVTSLPKNGKTRKNDMTHQLTETLRTSYQIQEALKGGMSVSDLVFSNRNWNRLGNKAFKIALDNCLDRIGSRKIRIHDLRHSYATIRLLRGHNIGDVSYQLGHSRISTTYDIYGHWTPGKFKSEVDELDGNEAPKRTLYAPTQ